MSRKEMAMEYFGQGYNCSQAVALAFADMVNIDKSELAKLAMSFGGGVGHMREVCGAVSGAAIILGLIYGNDEPGKNKPEHYERVQAVANAFKEETGSIVCRELLGLTNPDTSAPPEPRTDAYYKKRPCPELVGLAAEILDNYITKNDKF